LDRGEVCVYQHKVYEVFLGFEVGADFGHAARGEESGGVRPPPTIRLYARYLIARTAGQKNQLFYILFALLRAFIASFYVEHQRSKGTAIGR